MNIGWNGARPMSEKQFHNLCISSLGSDYQSRACRAVSGIDVRDSILFQELSYDREISIADVSEKLILGSF